MSVGKKTLTIAPSPWECVTPPEEDRATAIGNIHKKFGKDRACGLDLCSRTDRHTHTHTHTQTCLLQYFATAPAGEVINAKQPLKRVPGYAFQYPSGYPGFKIPENLSTRYICTNATEERARFRKRVHYIQTEAR